MENTKYQYITLKVETKEEYKEYLKTGKVSFDTESEVSSAEDFVTWVEYVDVDVEKIK